MTAAQVAAARRVGSGGAGHAGPVRAPATGFERLTPGVIRWGLVLSALVGLMIWLTGSSWLLMALPASYWLVAIVWNPFIGLLLVVGSVPVVESLPPLPLVTSLTAGFGALTLVGFVVRWRSVRLVNPTTLWATAFLCLGIVSTVVGPYGYPPAVQTLIQLFILFVLVHQLVRSRRDVELVMLAWVAVVAVVQVLGLVGFDLAAVGRANRLSSLARNANTLAFYSVLSATFALHFLLAARSRLRRLGLAAVLALDVVSVLLSVSRTGILALLLVGAGASLMLRRRVRRQALVGGLLLLGALMYFASRVDLAPVVAEIRGVPTMVAQAAQSQESSFGTRYWRWKRWIRLWSTTSPAFGLGLKAAAMKPVAGLPVAHNSFVSVLTDTGLFGFVAFCGLLGSSVRCLYRATAPERAAGRVGHASLWLLALVAWVVLSVTNDFQYYKILWLIAGMAVALERLADRPAPLRARFGEAPACAE